ncbi:mucin-2 protein [Nocardioides albertanoniae]|uniref:mucin-2 protein n=1 Tax=Nocardioides albertanoniae TaxID=1175486 RepID=UPI001FEB2C6D|nr:mucin-2 protein [Nocardioides albertanoniae]
MGAGAAFAEPTLIADKAGASIASSSKADVPSTRDDARVAGDRRETVVSRSGGDRESVSSVETLTKGPEQVETGTGKAVKRWTEETLNLWSAFGKHAAQAGEIEAGELVYATGRTESGRDEILVDGEVSWVTSGHLVDEKPEATGAAAGVSTAACGDSSVESGLVPDAVNVYRAVCNAFPEVASMTVGGWDAHGEHTSGKALDFMLSDKALGDSIAAFLQQHAAELNLYDIIYYQRIWTPVRASEGWRAMEDRGSATANHYDHVHVSTN